MPKYSVQFNGSTQYLSTARILDNSTDLTIEAWIYLTATPAANGAFIMGQYVGAGADRTIFNVDSTLKVGFQAGAVSMASTTTLGLNRWYHVAVTRVGSGTNNMALYINGTKEGQMTYTGTFQNTNTTIGYTPNLANTFLTGYISNFRIVKGTAVYTTNFTAPLDPLTAVANTALLTCNDTSIIDGSGNNVTITLNGSPVAGTFSPYFNGLGKKRSIRLNGSTQYTSVTNSSLLAFGTGDYTVECWVYITTATARPFVAGTTAGNYFCLIVEAGKLVTGRVGFAGAEELISTATVPQNTWVHLAGTRQSGTARIFINGNLDKSGAISTNYLTSPSVNYIGSDTSNFTNGYISNLRVVKGQCLYTASFTVPTAPLNSITNTTLLLGHDDTIIDGSTNNFTVTQVAAPTVSDFSPFYVGSVKLRNTVPQSFSATFNGTSDYLTIPHNSVFNFGASNFTIECWVNLSNYTSAQSIFTKRAVATTSVTEIQLYLFSGGLTLYASSDGSTFFINGVGTSAGSFTSNAWNHIALVRNGSEFAGYINGTKNVFGTSAATLMSNTASVAIGSDQASSFRNGVAGSISNYRVVNGTAVYTASFTVPTLPLTPIANTALLTLNDSTIKDGSSNNFAVTQSGAPVVSGLSTPFGPNFPSRLKFRKSLPISYSVSFNGSSALTLTGKSLSGANFTIEGWVYFNTFTTNDSPHMFNFGGDQNNRYLIWRNSGTGKFNLGVINLGTYTLTDGATTPVTGVWYHLAFVRNGSSNYLYVNGVQDATNNQAITTGTSWAIGKNQFDPVAGTHLNGYVSNFRVVTGSAVYTSNFTPPTAPLTAIANTALLTCNDSVVRDASTSNYTITVSGSAAVNTTSPITIDNFPQRLKIYSVT